MTIELMEQIHNNEKWEEFLNSLDNQYQRDIAGIVMDWIKETYPEFKDKLNGKLIAEVTRKI